MSFLKSTTSNNTGGGSGSSPFGGIGIAGGGVVQQSPVPGQPALPYQPPSYLPDSSPNYGYQMGIVPVRMLKMIAMRLHLSDGEMLPFDHIHACRVGDEQALVVVVKDGKYVVLEDEMALFPSDALVAKLRLLAK